MGSKRKRGAKDSSGIQQKKSKTGETKPKSTLISHEILSDKSPFIETPTGDDRKREATLYEYLGSEDEDERLAAADCIITALLGGEGVPEAVLQRHLDRRLFRGLASGRNASRVGFSLVITEILGQLYGPDGVKGSRYGQLTFERTLGFLLDKTLAVGNIPGQEERDHFFGQLFGLECFVRSQVLFHDTSRWKTVLDLLLKLGQKKIWLRSQCGWVIVQAIGQMDKTQAVATLEQLADAGLARTPEGVAVWLVVLGRFPGIDVKPWHNPLAKKSLSDLASVLKENVQDSTKGQPDTSNHAKQANWTAQLHFVWDIILQRFARAETDPEDFQGFWSRVVDEAFFSKNATDGQKFKGFSIFQHMLQHLSSEPEKLKVLFSRHMMACLMNQSAKVDRYLHRAAIKSLKTMEDAATTHPTSLGAILTGLLGNNGAYNFDQRTNTKTMDKLLQGVDARNYKTILSQVAKPIGRRTTMSEADKAAQDRVYVDYLSKMLNALATETVDDAQAAFVAVAKELALMAYGETGESEKRVSESTKELCRTRLESSLGKLARRKNDFATFCDAVSAIDPDSLEMDDEIKDALEAAQKRTEKLLKRKTKTKEQEFLSHGLAMLHAVTIFQLYNQDPDAVEVLNDLEQFTDRLGAGGETGAGDGNSELLVEVLLAMVARPSSLMREVSQQVFGAFTGQMSEDGLELLTTPLASGESTKGRQELFDVEDDEAMVVDAEESGDSEPDVEDVEEASDMEIGGGMEFVGLNGADDSANSGEEDDESDGEDDDEDQADAAKEGDGHNDLDEALSKILRSHRLDKDADAESSASDADMSDSEMLALDEKLGEVMKQRVKAKGDSRKDKKDAKQSVINFKHRILDLLDIYVKNEALNPRAFKLLSPLLNLMRTTSSKPLASRACEIILNYQKGLKKARSNKNETQASASSSSPPSSAEGLLGLLAEVHEEAGKDNSHAYARASSAASLIVASAMFAVDRECIKQVASIYGKTQSQWVLGEAKLQASFFVDWTNWCQNQASFVKS